MPASGSCTRRTPPADAIAQSYRLYPATKAVILRGRFRDAARSATNGLDGAADAVCVCVRAGVCVRLCVCACARARAARAATCDTARHPCGVDAFDGGRGGRGLSAGRTATRAREATAVNLNKFLRVCSARVVIVQFYSARVVATRRSNNVSEFKQIWRACKFMGACVVVCVVGGRTVNRIWTVI